ncbi:MAG: hypothetical protein R3F19_21335 [Verrucomicrobiales bacterium]
MKRIRMACLGVSAAAGLATGIAIGKAMRTTPETAGEPQRQRKSLLLAPVADMEAASTGNLAQLTVSAAKQAQFSESLANLDSDGCEELFEKWSRQLLVTSSAARLSGAQLFKHWTEIDPERAMKNLLALPFSDSRTGLEWSRVAAEGWAAAAANDPEALVKSLPQLQAFPNLSAKSLLISSLFGGIDAANFAETVRKASALRSALPAALTESVGIADDNAAVSAILDRWFPPHYYDQGSAFDHPRDPLDIYRYATTEIDDPKLRWQAQKLAFEQLAQLDPQLAATTLDDVGAPESAKEKTSLLAKLTAEWGNRDLPSAAKWMLERSPEERSGVLTAMFDDWSLLDPRQVEDFVQWIPASETPPGFAAGAARFWAVDDPDAALDWFESRPESKDPDVAESLLNNLWFGDWDKTLQGIGRLGQFDGLPQEKFDEELNHWVMFLDPDDRQLHKLTTLRDTSNNPGLAASIDRALIKAQVWKDPEAARQALSNSTHLSEEQRSTLLTDIGRMSRFREDPDKTLEWAAQLPPEDSASAIGSILPGHLRQTPAEGIPKAMDWLEGLPAEQLGNDYAANIAKSTARAIIESTGDPQAAANWAATGAPEPLREAAVGETISHWAQIDPFAAAEWLSSLDPGTVGDEPIVQLVDQIAWDPEHAFAWGATLSSPEMRGKKLAEIANRWALYAPDAARSAIEQADLPVETKATLIHSIFENGHE